MMMSWLCKLLVNSLYLNGSTPVDFISKETTQTNCFQVGHCGQIKTNQARNQEESDSFVDQDAFRCHIHLFKESYAKIKSMEISSYDAVQEEDGSYAPKIIF